MNKKYEFTDETKTIDGHLLHRIRRLSDGVIGGWIESEDNLAHEDDCWVYGNACVYGDAKVYGAAKVHDNANVCGKAVVHDVFLNGDMRIDGNIPAPVEDNMSDYGDNTKEFGDG